MMADSPNTGTDEYMSAASELEASSGPDDDDENPANESSSRNKRRRKHDRPPMERVELQRLYTTVNYDRPPPTREDVIIHVQKGKVKMSYVERVVRKYANHENLHNTSGTILHLESLPQMKSTYIVEEEALVAERGFSLGEAVARYKNSHKGDTQREHWRAYDQSAMLGQVIACKTTADMLILPAKKQVALNVPLTHIKQLELMNFNSSHNYCVYGDWLGDVQETVNDVTLVFNKYRCVARESSVDRRGVALIRPAADDRKSYVPGERVRISKADARSKFVNWEGEKPVWARQRGKASDHSMVTMLIEKVECRSADIRWLTSPSSVHPPPDRLEKEELKKLSLVDVSANPRYTSADRFLVQLNGSSVHVQKKGEYMDSLTDSYIVNFKRPCGRGCVQCKEVGTPHPPVEEANDAPSEEKKDEDMQSADEEAKKEEYTMEVVEEEDNSFLSTDVSSPVVVGGRPQSRLKRGRKPRRLGRLSRTEKNDATKAKKEKKENVTTDDFIGEVLIPHSYVDVEWMDGTITKNIPGYELVPVDPDLDQQDHLPGTLVALKANDGKHDDSFGIILCTDPEERVATVRWFILNAPTLDGIRIPVQAEDEKCTLFEIMLHPFYRRPPLGNFGVQIGRDSTDMKDVIFKVISNLQNGKQLVEYLNGEAGELWPMEMTAMDMQGAWDEGEEEDEDDTQIEFDETFDASSFVPPSLLQNMGQKLNDSIAHLVHAFRGSASTSSPSDSSSDQPGPSASFVQANNSMDTVIVSLLGSLNRNHATLSTHDLPANINKFLEKLKVVGISRDPASGLSPSVIASVLSEDSLSIEETERKVEFYRNAWRAVGIGALPNPSEHSDKWTPATLSRKKGMTDEQVDILKEVKDSLHRPEWMQDAARDLAARGSQMTLVHSIPQLQQMMESLEEKVAETKEEEQPGTSTGAAMEVDGGIEWWKESGEGDAPPTNEESPLKAESKESLPPVSKGSFTAAELGDYKHYGLNENQPQNTRAWMKAVAREHSHLREHVPEGVHVFYYENRMDLLTAVIVGPSGTPFELTPFLFDVLLPATFPIEPPRVHYYAYSQEQLNPNLYQAGKVCTSLLGTWSGNSEERWNPKSNLQQVFLSIQGLILNSEPYFNEAGYESRKEQPEMASHSKRYNETVAINSLEYLWRVYTTAPAPFRQCVWKIVDEGINEYHTRLMDWAEGRSLPAYPVHASTGFKLSLSKSAAKMMEVINTSRSSRV